MKQFVLTLVISQFAALIPFNLPEITKAIGSGDVAQLKTFLDEQVTITVFDKTNVYGKEKASELLQTFFKDFPPAGFRQMHQGSSKGADSQFCIGNLQTATKTFRVYIFMRVEANQSFIKELRFNEE